MNKKIIIELSETEYNELCKAWEAAKKSPVMPSKSLNIDDFCKELITSFTKMPDMSNLNVEDLMGQLGDLDSLKDMISSFTNVKKKDIKKEEPEKKEDLPDDQKYKS